MINKTDGPSVAIMQPYFFPYIGYWQLIKSVDKFVVFDDVNYINRGWINRNTILINREPHYLTVPLKKSSQNKNICETTIIDTPWKTKMLRTLTMAYKKAPFFFEVFETIERIIIFESENLSEYLYNQILVMSEFLGIDTEIQRTSRIYNNGELKKEKRILDICKQNGAGRYVNLPGGRGLYDRSEFERNGIELRFINPRLMPYRQHGVVEFQSPLSIIDVLMNIGPRNMGNHLKSCVVES